MTRKQPILELISFELCPYAQRSIITLKQAQIPYKVTYIDLSNKPGWFIDISPLGTVPILRIDDSEVLFDSSAMNEYLNDLVSAQLLSEQPVLRAQQRAWIQWASSQLMKQFQLTTASDKTAFDQALKLYREALTRFEGHVKEPFFAGEQLSLVDISVAPMIMRDYFLGCSINQEVYAGMKRLQSYADRLMQLDSVKDSVISDFEARWLARLQENKSTYLSTIV